MSNIQPLLSFFKKHEPSSQSVAEGRPSTTSSTSSSIKTASLQPKKPTFGDIRNIDPTIYLKQNPTNDLQKWAVGTVFKTVHQGANKCLSNAAVVENYEIGYEMINEYHNTIKNSHDQLRKIPLPPKVHLNCHNILDVQKVILEVNLLSFCHYEKLDLNILGNVFPIEYFHIGENKKNPSFKLSGSPQTSLFLQTLALNPIRDGGQKVTPISFCPVTSKCRN